jgi:hypothetical protein
MAGITCCDVSKMAALANPKKMEHVVRRCMDVHTHSWNFI